jgi:hypothetical protein
VSVPLRTQPPFVSSSSSPTPVGFNYLLTYLDEDMLVGRAQGNGGTFIFSREVEEGQQPAAGGAGAVEVQGEEVLVM